MCIVRWNNFYFDFRIQRVNVVLGDLHSLKKRNTDLFGIYVTYFVRMEGLEPPRLTAPDPKSGAATNYATSGFGNQITPKRDANIQPYMKLSTKK